MIECKDCGQSVDKLELFPENRCLECHAKVFVMPTARELVQMWGGK